MKVAYLTMAYSPDHYYRRIVNMAWQSYPADMKVHILLHQRMKLTGEFPKHIDHDYSHKIKEVDVEGDWPALWGLKMCKGIEVAAKYECEAILIIDEDDEYHHMWTAKLVSFINHGHDVAWTWINRDVKRGSIKVAEYPSPSGAMIMRTNIAVEAARIFSGRYPSGKRHDDSKGALDLTFCKILLEIGANVKEFTDRDIEPRAYFRGAYANTRKRVYEEDIDYGFDYGDKRAKSGIRDNDSRATRKRKKAFKELKVAHKIG